MKKFASSILISALLCSVIFMVTGCSNKDVSAGNVVSNDDSVVSLHYDDLKDSTKTKDTTEQLQTRLQDAINSIESVETCTLTITDNSAQINIKTPDNSELNETQTNLIKTMIANTLPNIKADNITITY